MGNILKNNGNIILIMSPNTERQVLANNIERLLELHSWSMRDLAKKAQIAPKTVSNMVSGEFAASIDNIKKVSKAFSLPSWVILVPNLPDELLMGYGLERLVTRYTSSTGETKTYIDSILERESV